MLEHLRFVYLHSQALKHSPVVSHLQQVDGPFLQRTGLNKAWLSAEGLLNSASWALLVMLSDGRFLSWDMATPFFHAGNMSCKNVCIYIYIYIYIYVCTDINMHIYMLHLLLGKYQSYAEDVHSFFLSVTLSNLQLEKTYTLFWGFQGHPHFDKVPIWYQSQAFGRRPKSTTLIQLHLLRVPGLSWHIARTTSLEANKCWHVMLSTTWTKPLEA